MRFGVCIGGDYEKISVAKQCGFDYVESAFELLAADPKEKFEGFLAELKRNDMTCESVNCFLPRNLNVVGENVDMDALGAYVKKGMENGEKLGVKTVVFGSGGARRIPDGFPFNKAMLQLKDFLNQVAAPNAAAHGITIVIEPLNDANSINTVKEGAILAALADEPNVACLVDLFHMVKVGDTVEDILQLKGFLRHAHIAEPSCRVYPSFEDEYDYHPFIRALEDIGCPRCSLEAGCKDFASEAKIAAEVLKNILWLRNY